MEGSLDLLLNRSNSDKQRSVTPAAKAPAAGSPLQQQGLRGLNASAQKQQIIVPTCSTGRSASFKLPDNSGAVKKNLAPIAVVLSKDKRITGNPNLLLSPLIFLSNDKSQKKGNSSNVQSKTVQPQTRTPSLVSRLPKPTNVAAKPAGQNSSIKPKETFTDFRDDRDSSIEAEDSLGTLLSKHFEAEANEDATTTLTQADIAKRRILHEKARIRHICNICNRECPSKHKLRRHLSTHSEERPFTCHMCGRTFKWKGYLQKHIRQQHSSGSAEMSPTSPLISPAAGQSQVTPDNPSFSASLITSPTASHPHTITQSLPTHSHHHRKRKKHDKSSRTNSLSELTTSDNHLHRKRHETTESTSVTVLESELDKDSEPVDSLIVSIPKIHRISVNANNEQAMEVLDIVLEEIGNKTSVSTGQEMNCGLSTAVSAIMAEPVPTNCIQNNRAVSMTSGLGMQGNMNRSQGFEDDDFQQFCFSTSSEHTDVLLPQEYGHSLNTDTPSTLPSFSSMANDLPLSMQSGSNSMNVSSSMHSKESMFQDSQSSMDPLSQNRGTFSSSLQPPDLIQVSQFNPNNSNMSYDQELNDTVNFDYSDPLNSQYPMFNGQMFDGDDLMDDLNMPLGYMSPGLGMFDNCMSSPSYLDIQQAQQLLYENSQQMRRILRSYQSLQNTLLRVTAGTMLNTGPVYNGLIDDQGLLTPPQKDHMMQLAPLPMDMTIDQMQSLNSNVPQQQDTTQPSGHMTQLQDQMTRPQDHVTHTQDHMTQLQDQFIPSVTHSQGASQPTNLGQSQDHTTQQQSHVTQSQNHMMQPFDLHMDSTSQQLSNSISASTQSTNDEPLTLESTLELLDSSTQISCEPDDLLIRIITEKEPSDLELSPPIEKRPRLDNPSLFDVGIQCELGPETIIDLINEEQMALQENDQNSQVEQLTIGQNPLSNGSQSPTSIPQEMTTELGAQTNGAAPAEPNIITLTADEILAMSRDSLDDGEQDSGEPGRMVNKYRCGAEGCGKAYLHRKDLTRHIKIRHGAYVMPKMLKPVAMETAEKPYVCSIGSCGRSYHHMRDLRRHQRNSHGENSKSPPEVQSNLTKDDNWEYNNIFGKIQLRYPCDYPGCVRSYVHKKDLIRHKRLYHKDTNAKPSVPGPIPYSDSDLRIMRHEVKQEVEQLMKRARLDGTSSTCSSVTSTSETDALSPDTLLSTLNADVFLSLGISPPPLETDNGSPDSAAVNANTAQIISLIQNLTTNTPQIGEMQIPQFPLPITVPVIPVVADSQLNGIKPTLSNTSSKTEGANSCESLKQVLSKPTECTSTKAAVQINEATKPSSSEINNILDISAQELVDSLKPRTEMEKGTRRSPDTLANLAAAVLSMSESELSNVLIKTVSDSTALAPAPEVVTPTIASEVPSQSTETPPETQDNDMEMTALSSPLKSADSSFDDEHNIIDTVLAIELSDELQASGDLSQKIPSMNETSSSALTT